MWNRKILRRVILAGIMILPGLHPIPALAQVPEETQDRLRALYEDDAFRTRSFQADWLADGSGFTRLEQPSGSDASELVRYDADGGTRTVLVSLAELTPTGAEAPVTVEGYAFSPDGSVLLLEANGRTDDDGEGRVSEYWTLERSSGLLRKIADRVGGGSLAASFSPDGRRVLFSRAEDLWVTDIAGARTVRLTTDGVTDSLTNRPNPPGSGGRPGWATGGIWSPDGRQIVYVQSDVSKIPFRPMLDPVDPTYPLVRMERYARVGGPIPKLSVGVVPSGGGETRWLPIPSPDEGFYLGDVAWAGNSREVWLEHRSRGRDARSFLMVDVESGEITTMYHETDPAWVIASYRVNAGLDWIEDGDAWVLVSEKDGWRHAYTYSRDGEELALLTPGESEIIERGPVIGDWLYYYASPENATQRYLWRVRVDGAGEPEQVTPEDQAGSHNYDISPDGRRALHTWSDFNTPPITELVSLPDHSTVRVLEDNAEVRARATEMLGGNTEFLKIDIGDGVVMDAWMIKPRDLDPDRSYPLFVYVYGEPHGTTVKDQWSGNQIYHQTLADLGYIVVSMDNRGTPAPKGAAWRRVPFPTLGVLSTEEQAAGVLELGRMRSFVDASRVGTWGWSGGGSNTLNAVFRRPDVFDVGIAVAPKPQPWLYNAWFQEIYMGTREQHPDGYAISAPINFAEGLEGDLLIVHGTGETNTHLEITEGLVDRLIALGKPFEYMTYPGRDHGISRGEGTSLHLRMLMTRWLLEHLPPGPR